jgi:hypothetical protein
MLNYSNYLYKSIKVPGNITLAAQATYSITALIIKAASERKTKAAIAKKQADLGSNETDVQSI